MFLQLSPLALFLPLFSIADLKERRIPNRLLLLALLPGMAAQNPHFLLRLCLSALLFIPGSACISSARAMSSSSVSAAPIWGSPPFSVSFF